MCCCRPCSRTAKGIARIRDDRSASCVWSSPVVLFVVDLYDINVIDLVLGRLGKDSTLSGRTVLWDFAVDAYERKPWLGYGYKGYWSGADSTVYLLRYCHGAGPLRCSITTFSRCWLGSVSWPRRPHRHAALRLHLRHSELRQEPDLYQRLADHLSRGGHVAVLLENPLFNNHGSAELILVSIITAGGLKGWVRRGGALVRVETRPPTWTAEPIGDRVPAR